MQGARRFTYHPSGQLEREVRADGTVYRYELDPEGRVSRVAGRDGFVAGYAYDAAGLRVSKRVRGEDAEDGTRDPAADPRVHFVHAPDGRLLAEHDGATSAVLREYVYLGLMPMAMIQAGEFYAVHADQVAQPQKLTDARGLVVHDRVTTPFGERVVSLEQTSLPLAFPGQREDAETGLSYNWHRDYDPALGRYVQSDPIGLAGGMATYGYAMQNPLRYVDSMGLDVELCRQPAFGLSWNPVDHVWFRTDDFTSGMGPSKSSCGDAGNGSGDRPGDPVQTCDHSERNMDGATCTPLQNVDEACVNQMIEPGRDLGHWGPTNQCQSFANDVLNMCRTDCQSTPLGPVCRRSIYP